MPVFKRIGPHLAVKVGGRVVGLAVRQGATQWELTLQHPLVAVTQGLQSRAAVMVAATRFLGGQR